MPDSDVIVIDDDNPAPSRKRRPRAAASKPIVIDSDGDYEPTPQGRRKQAKRTAATAAGAAKYEDEELQQPAKKQQRKQKQPKEPKQKKVKEPVEKRTDELGRTVRFAQSPSQAVYTRIQRALPGAHSTALKQQQQHVAARTSCSARMLLLSTQAIQGCPAGCLVQLCAA